MSLFVSFVKPIRSLTDYWWSQLTYQVSGCVCVNEKNKCGGDESKAACKLLSLLNFGCGILLPILPNTKASLPPAFPDFSGLSTVSPVRCSFSPRRSVTLSIPASFFHSPPTNLSYFCWNTSLIDSESSRSRPRVFSDWVPYRLLESYFETYWAPYRFTCEFICSLCRSWLEEFRV